MPGMTSPDAVGPVDSVGTSPARPVQSTVTTPGLTLSAACLALGAILLTAAFAFGLLPKALDAPTVGWQWTFGVAAVGLSLVAFALLVLARQVGTLEDDAEQLQEPARSTKLYGIYLVGVGFALLVQALACSLVFVAVGWSVGQRLEFAAAHGVTTAAATVPHAGNVADQGFGKLFGNSKDDALGIVGMFVLSTMVAIVGALFFFANALYQKMGEPTRDPFDRQMFWGGLWFRMGEAILFNLVFFLVIRSSNTGTNTLMLPLVSLLVGMFLKPGEALVSGIATRVFTAFQALVPADGSKQKEIKLLAFNIVGFPADATADIIKDKVAGMVAAIKSLAGVSQVEADGVSKTARVEYDASAVSVDDIRRKVELKGLEMV